MVSNKYIFIMLTCVSLATYCADQPTFWERMKPYVTGLFATGLGGTAGATLAPRLQQNRYVGALCGAGLGLTSAYLLNWIYKYTTQEPASFLEPQDIALNRLENNIRSRNKQAITDFQTYEFKPETILNNRGDTPLHVAVLRLNDTFLQWFTERYKENINNLYLIKNKAGITPLTLAINNMGYYLKRPEYPTYQILLETHPLYRHIPQIIADKNMYTESQQKIINDEIRHLRQLTGQKIEKTAPPLPKDKQPLDENKLLYSMIINKKPEAKIYFEQYNFTPDTTFNDNGDTALHVAIRNTNYEFVDWFIKKYKEDIDNILIRRTSNRASPLLIAVYNIDKWNKTDSVDGLKRLFTENPLYQHILDIIAHQNKYSAETQQHIESTITILKKKIGKDNLKELIDKKLQAEQGTCHEKEKALPAASSAPQEPIAVPISKAEPETYKQTMADMILHKDPQAITDFQKYNFAPDTILDDDGDTALHIAIRHLNHEFVNRLINQYSKEDINNLLMTRNKMQISSLHAAMTYMQKWNCSGNNYANLQQLLTEDPLYQRILGIIAHKNRYLSTAQQQDIGLAIVKIKNTIGEDHLNQLLEQARQKE